MFFLCNAAPEGSSAGESMVLAILYEALLGSKRVRGTTPIVQIIKAQKPALRDMFRERNSASTSKGHSSISRESNGLCFAFQNGHCPKGDMCMFEHRIDFPRYVRVNTIAVTEQEAVDHLQVVAVVKCSIYETNHIFEAEK